MERSVIKKVLIANRGEIARRIIRTLKKMDIRSVVVFDERENNARCVREADQAISLGTGKTDTTFLNIPAILEIAKKLQVDAIHPGYGFLSENDEFARRCIQEGIIFIGPDPKVIRLMGNKPEALDMARRVGVPVIPGLQGEIDEITGLIDDSWFPVLIKASSGGGGKAMRLAWNRDELPGMLQNASEEAKKYFARGGVFVEKYLKDPRHIEVQVLGDKYGNLVHLFERECSIQRRFQKIVEESPATSLTGEKRKAIIRDALKIAGEAGYHNAGTVEFLLDGEGNHYFLEMNTRIQVEHPVTEEITGVDIIREQIRIAEGKELSAHLHSARQEGHVMEVRLYAEDPGKNFRPSPGRINYIRFPEMEGLRIETAVENGTQMEMDFDPMLAKYIISGKNREDTIDRLLRALYNTHIHGISTNKYFLQRLLVDPGFISNHISTDYINQQAGLLSEHPAPETKEQVRWALAALYISMNLLTGDYPDDRISHHPVGYWRIMPGLEIRSGAAGFRFDRIMDRKQKFSAFFEGNMYDMDILDTSGDRISFIFQGRDHKVYFSWDPVEGLLYLSDESGMHEFARTDWLVSSKSYAVPENTSPGNGETRILAPLSGQVIKINLTPDVLAGRGDSLLVIESMKMENEIRIPAEGKVRKLFVREGQQVREGDLLAEVYPE